MYNFWVRLFIFATFNFGALALGSLFTSDGVASAWYQHLNKAPWTPPGAVFGIAWFTVMLCFSFYMAYMTQGIPTRKTLSFYLLFLLQWFLNILWNPTFFFFQEINIALMVIVMLLLVVSVFLYLGFKRKPLYALLVLPYVVWLIIATSLNAYISLYN
ncbi:MAG TPA: TspO/MBR family protein [Cytophagales bacterium]|nr:TspO/MBR family protein [Cytophagales bacterium]